MGQLPPRHTLLHAISLEAYIFNERAADNGSPDLQGVASTKRSFKMQTSIRPTTMTARIRSFSTICVLAYIAAALSYSLAGAAESPACPNIVLIMADDK